MKNMRKTFIAAVAGWAMTACLTATAVNVNVIDVTTAGNSGNGDAANGAIFNYADPQPTGTGYIDPFLREQNNGTELGVNTDIKAQVVNTLAYDNKDPVNYTHDLSVGTLSIFTVNGRNYYEFGLDANQSANAPISLVRFQVFVSDTKFTDAAALAAFISGTTPAFDMNGPGNQKYRVDISSQRGSGSGDMSVLVPVVGVAGQYLYLVAGFGVDVNGDGFATNDGFEEWTAKTGTPPPVPDGGSTLLLLGSAFATLGLFARGRKNIA